MAWETSDRRRFLPKDWDRLRAQRFEMDGHRCTFRDPDTRERCSAEAEECDHIGARTDHRLHMLRSLCSYHHAKKSSSEGRAALDAKRAIIDQRFRRTEPHPGDL